MDSKLIVIAIGGNSLIEDSRHVTVSAQAEAAAKTAHHIAKLIKEGHKVVIAHGNGPQVGQKDSSHSSSGQLRRRHPGCDRIPAAAGSFQ